MPPKRGHGHGDEDLGEGSSTLKKIKIVRGEEFICEYCGDNLETAKHLQNHKRKHQTFECQKCNKCFSLENKERHIKRCKGNVAVATMKRCDECDYETNSQYNLNRHKKKHSSFMCEECGESLPTLHKLDKHKSEVHPVKYYKCEDCDFKSTKKWLRKRHQELNCRVRKNKMIPALSEQEAVQLFSDCNITKADFNRI